ncbi:uncharacterized protein LOC119339601 [Triticum dicoccoides]|uniref:uncharacterized protein LOC119339601 n=1 Tax=Triticum dicoccoides TaxID=85692 RepID=UPI0018918ED1|nr:uncharacterized protein LOC119339601 [Triticum dicoccoides]
MWILESNNTVTASVLPATGSSIAGFVKNMITKDTSYMDLEVLERILDGREKPTNLSLALLKDITENFSDDREIGHGGFATVYKYLVYIEVRQPDELRGLEWNTRYGIIRGICEDFGLSRLDEKSKTMSEYRLGSLGYCAPEYISEGNMSFKSDMYSLGKIIIELVTGGKEILNNSNTVLRRWRHRWKKSGKETPLVYQQVAKCIEIGLLCQEREPSKRPFIWDIINDISHMEVVNEEINNANEYTFGKISSCLEEDDMLGIEPLKLHFPFALNKQMSCEIQLTNETDSYIAFNVQNMSPKSYNTQPQKDIMPPRSKCNIEITLQAQGNVPIDMQRANEFVVWSTKVNDGIAFEDITKSMFIKETINVVDEVNLDVVFDVSEPQEASDKISEGNALTDRANESTVWSTKVMIDGLAIEDITTNKLIKESDTMVDEVHLDVVFDANEVHLDVVFDANEIIDDTAGKIYCIDAHQKEPLIIVGTSLGNVKTWNYNTQLRMLSSLHERDVAETGPRQPAWGVMVVCFVDRSDYCTYNATRTRYCTHLFLVNLPTASSAVSIADDQTGKLEQNKKRKTMTATVEIPPDLKQDLISLRATWWSSTTLLEVNQNNIPMSPLHYPVMTLPLVEVSALTASSADAQLCAPEAAPGAGSAEKPQGEATYASKHGNRKTCWQDIYQSYVWAVCPHGVAMQACTEGTKIPKKHIVKRWTRDARDILPPNLTQAFHNLYSILPLPGNDPAEEVSKNSMGQRSPNKYEEEEESDDEAESAPSPPISVDPENTCKRQHDLNDDGDDHANRALKKP